MAVRRVQTNARGHSGSLRSLWRHSVNYRRLGYGAMVVALLALIGLTTDPVLPPPYAWPAAPYAGGPGQGGLPGNFAPARATAPATDLSQFPMANSTWGLTLNPAGLNSTEHFHAFYINTQEPLRVVHQERTQRIAVNYAFQDFHDIPSHDFGAYWVKKLRIDTPTVYKFGIDQSHAQTRIIIDGHVVFEGSGSAPAVELQAGEHLLEVEYINNWHTTNYQLSFQPLIAVLRPEEVAQAVAHLHPPPDTMVYVAAVYESRDKGNLVSVQVDDPQRPYLLVLSSYSAVNWEVRTPRPPLAIIYNNAMTSTVTASGSPPLLPASGTPGYALFDIRGINVQCVCVAGHSSCSGSTSQVDLHKADQQIRTLTGYPLAGATGRYGAAMLEVPEVSMNPEDMARISALLGRQKAAQLDCRKTRQDFEAMTRQHP